MNRRICFVCFFTCHGKQIKSSVHFLGESMARQSAFRFCLTLPTHLFADVIYGWSLIWIVPLSSKSSTALACPHLDDKWRPHTPPREGKFTSAPWSSKSRIKWAWPCRDAKCRGATPLWNEKKKSKFFCFYNIVLTIHIWFCFVCF